MANFHSRSNSFPSQSHPIMSSIEDHLCRIRSSEATSASADSLCSSVSSLRHLHEDINNMIQMSSIQQALSQEHGQSQINGLLDDYLVLVDLCGFAREVLLLKKGSVQELQSSIRRNRCESASHDEINAYLASEKKINKRIRKFIKNLKGFHKNSSSDNDFQGVARVLKETGTLNASALNLVLMFISGEKKISKNKSFSLFSKFTKTSRVHSETEHEQFFSLKQLQALEMSIQELDEGLEALFRCLVKTRVSLLNVLTN